MGITVVAKEIEDNGYAEFRRLNKVHITFSDYYVRRIFLGNSGAVSWVRKKGGESFQERTGEPMGCYT